jgi:hypothetical protein
LTGAVADRRALLLNERRTCGFDRDTRKDRATAILHDTGDRAELGKAQCREDEYGERARHEVADDLTHTLSFCV